MRQATDAPPSRPAKAWQAGIADALHDPRAVALSGHLNSPPNKVASWPRDAALPTTGELGVTCYLGRSSFSITGVENRRGLGWHSHCGGFIVWGCRTDRGGLEYDRGVLPERGSDPRFRRANCGASRLPRFNLLDTELPVAWVLDDHGGVGRLLHDVVVDAAHVVSGFAISRPQTQSPVSQAQLGGGVGEFTRNRAFADG